MQHLRLTLSRVLRLIRPVHQPRRQFPRPGRFAAICGLGALAVSAVGTPLSSSIAQSLGATDRISVNEQGGEGNAASGPAVFAPNGNFVTFLSGASNLVPSDNNGVADIFIKNLTTGAVQRANVNSNGVAANGESFVPSISPSAPNGFGVVVFASDADNLWRPASGLPDSNAERDVFFSLPGRSRIGRVSIGVGPAVANGPSFDPSVTILAEPNRMVVAYTSGASNLLQSDTNGVQDVFLTTISNSESDGPPNFSEDYSTILVSKAADSSQVSDGPSGAAQVSGDGRFVVFESVATNLVEGISPSFKQVYLYDVEQDTTTLISKGTDGTPGDALSRNPSISFSGTYVVFLTRASNIINDGFIPDGDAMQVVRYNTRSGTYDRVNAAADGTPGNGASGVLMNAQITADGRLVAFSDVASNLVDGDTNGVSDIFLKDMDTDAVTRISNGLAGEADGASRFPFLSRATFGSTSVSVLFASSAANLVENDVGGRIDVFRTSYTASVPQLTATTRIEVPPDVVLADDDITVTTEAYRIGPSALRSASDHAVAFATRRKKIRYLVESSKEGEVGSAADRRRKITRRNTITLKNLDTGTYLVRYRILTYRDGKVVRKTPYSPAQRVSRAS